MKPTQKQQGWEERFDEKLWGLCDDDMREYFDIQALSVTKIKSFIQQEIDRERERIIKIVCHLPSDVIQFTDEDYKNDTLSSVISRNELLKNLTPSGEESK